jgi:hypothetical protein
LQKIHAIGGCARGYVRYGPIQLVPKRSEARVVDSGAGKTMASMPEGSARIVRAGVPRRRGNDDSNLVR